MSVGILVDIGTSLTKFASATFSIDLDVTMDEVHEWQNDVTTNPVETGSPITDHIQSMPDKITITGMISDSGISDAVIKEFSNVDSSEFLTRVQTAFDLLYKLKDERKLVTVYTKYKVYTDMAVSSLSIPRNSTIGDSINFTAEFMKVRLVNTQTVDMPKAISAKKTAKTGKSVQRKTEAKKDNGKVATPDLTKSQSSSVLKSVSENGVKSVLTSITKLTGVN